MRKKSHVLLAVYLVNNLNIEELAAHRKAFYLGSILPDCRPSFVTTPHCYTRTIGLVREKIGKIIEESSIEGELTSVFCRKLGEISHYLADYFTFPHNENFEGTVKEHCIYEGNLKTALENYIENGQVKEEKRERGRFRSLDDLMEFIDGVYKEYCRVKRCVAEDCVYIVSIVSMVIEGIINLITQFGNHRLILQGV